MVAAITPEMPHVSDVVRLSGARLPRKCPFLASAILPRTGGATSPRCLREAWSLGCSFMDFSVCVYLKTLSDTRRTYFESDIGVCSPWSFMI